MQQPPSQGVGGAGSELRPDTQQFGDSSASSATQQPPSGPSEPLSSELRSDAQQLGSKAAHRVESELDARKGTAAAQVKSVSSALEKTAGELDDGSPEWLKSTLRQGAQQVQRFADTVEHKDSRQLLNDVQSFARERPGTFLAACAAAGFAAARIFKAGGEQGASTAQFPAEAEIDEPPFRTSQPEPPLAARTPGEFV